MDREEATKILSLRRQNAIGTLGSLPREANYTAKNVLIDEISAYDLAIAALQEPERKKGQWERYHKYEFGSDKWGYKCSECGNEISDDDSSIIKNFLTPNFCEHCGADMRDTDAETDFIDTGDW